MHQAMVNKTPIPLIKILLLQIKLHSVQDR